MRIKIRFAIGILVVITLLQGVLALVLIGQIRGTEEDRNAANTMRAEVATIEMQHYRWLQNLTLALYNDAEFTGSLNYETCSLGSWLSRPDIQNHSDPNISQAVTDIYTPHRAIHEAAAQIMELMSAGGFDIETDRAQLDHIFDQTVVPNMEKTIGLLEEIAVFAEGNMSALEVQSKQINSTTTFIVTLVTIVSIAVGAASMIWLVRQVIPPLKQLTAGADRLTVGDVQIELDIKNKDEFADLGRAFQEMARRIKYQSDTLKLISEGDYTMTVPESSEQDAMNKAINYMLDQNNEMISNIRASALQVDAGAKQLAGASQNLAQGSSEQASTLQELADTIADVQLKAEEIAQTALSTSKDVEQTGKLMAECNQGMQRMLGAMNEIDMSSQNISKVIKVIDDIAFQTNILALNAAVEAARAGQHGKGFAVVADEVRNLASKSAEAAKETAALIENSLSSVSEGNQIVDMVNQSIRGVGEISAKNAQSVGAINAASQQQSAAMIQITAAVGQLTNVVQASSATAEETAASSEEMSAQSALLSNSVARFRLRSDKAADEELSPSIQASSPATGMALTANKY